MMMKSIVLLSVIALGVIGCGEQRGRFFTTGDQYAPFSPQAAVAQFVDGYDPKDTNQRHLLYLLIICPGVQGDMTGGSTDYGQYVTTLSHTWSTKTGAIIVSIPWDRRTDIVEIGMRKFSREKGNVFVVRAELNKELVGQQLTSLGPDASFRQLLEHVRQQLPKDEFIGSLNLPDDK